MVRIIRLLSIYPELRDSDLHLIAEVHNEEMNGLDINQYDACVNGYFKLLIQKKLSHPVSIVRQRQLIQANNDFAHLRGKVYEKKHQLQSQIKEEVKEVAQEVSDISPNQLKLEI